METYTWVNGCRTNWKVTDVSKNNVETPLRVSSKIICFTVTGSSNAKMVTYTRESGSKIRSMDLENIRVHKETVTKGSGLKIRDMVRVFNV